MIRVESQEVVHTGAYGMLKVATTTTGGTLYEQPQQA
jgi:hypothetical protein